MIVNVLIVLAAVLVVAAIGLVILVALQPSEFRVTRSTKISAPPPAVFGQVNDFHKWTGWSPWEKLDPELKRTYDGSAAGTGAIYSWNGNNKVGQGRMTIMESRPSDSIRIKLEFMRPFVCTNTAEFTFQPEGNQTEVTWSMTGQNTFMGKAFHLLMNMDKMVGGDFEKGLASMKSLAEGNGK